MYTSIVSPVFYVSYHPSQRWKSKHILHFIISTINIMVRKHDGWHCIKTCILQLFFLPTSLTRNYTFFNLNDKFDSSKMLCNIMVRFFCSVLLNIMLILNKIDRSSYHTRITNMHNEEYNGRRRRCGDAYIRALGELPPQMITCSSQHVFVPIYVHSFCP